MRLPFPVGLMALSTFQPVRSAPGPYSPFPCPDADIPWSDGPSSPISLDSAKTANITTRHRHIHNVHISSRVNVEETSDSDISVAFDVSFTSDELSKAVSYEESSNGAALIIDGTDLDDHPGPNRNCIVADTTIKIPSSLSHLILDNDNSGVTFHGVSSKFDKLELLSSNGAIIFTESSVPVIKEFSGTVSNGGMGTRDPESLLKTTESAYLRSKNGAIRARISGPKIDASTSNGAVQLVVLPSSSKTSKQEISATSHSGHVGLLVVSPESPLSLKASANAGAVDTKILSPVHSGKFHLETKVGGMVANGNLKIIKSKKGFVGGMMEGVFDGEKDGDSTAEMSSTTGAVRFFVGERTGDEREAERAFWEEGGHEDDGEQDGRPPHGQPDHDGHRRPGWGSGTLLFAPHVFWPLLVVLVIAAVVFSGEKNKRERRAGYVKI